MAMLIPVGSKVGPKSISLQPEVQIPSWLTTSRRTDVDKPEIYLYKYQIME